MADPEKPIQYCLQTHPGEEENRQSRRRRRRGGGEMEGGTRKRKLSKEQAMFLERSFREERKLESGRKERLAGEAGLDPKQVAVWFQNRRARWRSKRVEEEYAELKATHDSAVLDNRRLEAQISKLKEQLSDAHMEIAKLSCDSCSPRTPISVDTHQPSVHDEHYANIWDCTWNLYGFDDMYPSPIF